MRWVDVWAGERGAEAKVVALGNFDGVHVGHRRVLRAAVEVAQSLGTEAAVLVLHPHPRQVLRPETFPGLLTPLPERRRWLARAGISLGLVLPFDRAVAERPAKWFVEEVLVGRIGARAVVVGENYRFGHGQEGDVAYLTALGARLGVAVHALPTETRGELPVSASRIRQALSAGDLDSVRRLLGRPYAVEGRVVAGDGRGRTLGFPTANLAVDPEWFLPRPGVYQVVVPGFGGAVANLGFRPTFGGGELRLEVHLLRPDVPSLYGRVLRVVFQRYLREEQAFQDVASLVAAIRQDVRDAVARPFIAGPEDLW